MIDHEKIRDEIRLILSMECIDKAEIMFKYFKKVIDEEFGKNYGEEKKRKPDDQ